jgi:hypothetical protein
VSGVYVVRDGIASACGRCGPAGSRATWSKFWPGWSRANTVALDPIKAGVYLKEQQQRTVEK